LREIGKNLTGEVRDAFYQRYRLLTEDDVVMYQEYIQGETLGSMLRAGYIDVVDLNGTLCYLHGLLAYLYNKLEFAHNDLHYDNIMLRFVDGVVTLPILRSDGHVLRYIALPFIPTMLDMGMAKTKYTVIPGVVTGYLNNEISDIIGLNRPMLWEEGRIDNNNIPSYLYASEVLSENADLNLNQVGIEGYPGAYMRYMSSGILTHDSVVEYILDSKAVDSITVEPSFSSIYQNSGLYDYTVGDTTEIRQKAQACLSKYSVIEREESSPGLNILNQAAIVYCNGVLQFYGNIARE
jgi:hypothetical protein